MILGAIVLVLVVNAVVLWACCAVGGRNDDDGRL